MTTTPTWNSIPTMELPQQRQLPVEGGPNYSDPQSVAARVGKSVPMIVGKEVKAVDDDASDSDGKDLFAGSNATFARWLKEGSITEEDYEAATGKKIEKKAEEPAEDSEVSAAPAVRRTSAMREELPADVQPEPVGPAAIAPAPIDVQAERVEAKADAAQVEPEIAEPEVAELVEQVGHVVAEQLGAEEYAPADAEDPEITYKAAYKEALRQLKVENPDLARSERRRLARRIANEVVHGPAEYVAGFYAAPERPAAAGSLRRKAADLLLRAGVVMDTAQKAKVEEYPRGLKLALGALGIVAAAGVGLYLTYKGINGTVNATIPNLEMLQPDQTPTPRTPSGTVYAGR